VNVTASTLHTCEVRTHVNVTASTLHTCEVRTHVDDTATKVLYQMLRWKLRADNVYFRGYRY
jgi:hypothetical protein